MKVWSKTLLSVYRYLGSLSKALDNLIVKKSVNSMFYTNSRGHNTYDCASEIIELTQRKVNLINLKVLVDDALSKMSYENKRILILYYVDGLKTSQIAKIMGCVDRTFFRKKDEAVISFGRTLKNMGINEEKLSQMFGKEKWLNEFFVKNQVREKSSKTAKQVPEYNFLKKVIRELSCVNFKKSSYGY